MERLKIITDLIRQLIQADHLACPVCAIRQTSHDERAIAIQLCKDQEIGFDWHLVSAAHNDPTEYYQMLFNNRHRQILIIDHAERIFTDPTLASIMRQASEFEPERTIDHPEMTTSFQTKCRYILFSETGVSGNLPMIAENLRGLVHGLFDRGCAPFI